MNTTGTITQIIGAVVDAQFDEKTIPAIYNGSCSKCSSTSAPASSAPSR